MRLRSFFLISTFFIFLFLAAPVFTQCTLPIAPTISGSGGPDHLEINWTVGNFDPTAGTQVWMSLNLGVNYVAWSNVTPSEPSGSRGYIGANWPVRLFARSTNACGFTDSGIIIVTTFDLPNPPIQAYAGPDPYQITIWSHYIGPPNHAHGVALHGVYPNNVDQNWFNFSSAEEPPQTFNVGMLGLYRFYATTPINPWENRTSSTVYVVLDDNQNAGNPACYESRGKPVNAINGNMYLDEIDYSLPGIGESINLTRSYNSIIQSSGLFGHGWSTQYEENITQIADHGLRLGMPDGRAVYFGRPNTNVSTFTPATQDFSGSIVKNVDSTYTLNSHDGRVRQFNANGKLLWQKDRNGNQTTLNYNTSGVLTGITDAYNRTLSFTVNSNGFVSQVSDALGVVATYAYDTTTPNLLKTVTYNDGSKSKFEYIIDEKVK